MADEKKRPSVAEILAAARKADSKRAEDDAPAEAAAPAAPAEPAEVEAAAESSAVLPAKATPAAKPKPAGAAGGAAGRPSVAEMLAAARAEKAAAAGGETKAAAPAAKPAAAKPTAAKPAAAKPATVKPAAVKPAVAKPVAAAPKETATASILAAARSADQPGPITKSEAAARPKVPREPVAAAKAKLTVPPMPVKPDYAKPKPAPSKSEATEDRRGFFNLLLGSFLGLGFTSLSLTTGLMSLGTARFMFPNILTEPPSRFKVGFKDSFPFGVVETKFVAEHGVWVVNWEYKGKKEIYALKTVCTHLGCTPNWLEAEQKFKCPCHGSGYYKDGVNFEGPAPRPLERYAIKIGDDGQLEIDKSKTFHEELGQWTDPASFVTV